MRTAHITRAPAEPEHGGLPAAVNDSWRTWLMTGIRRAPIARRRVRGAYKGLKKMLVEGMSNGGDRPHSWTNFSGVMVRQALDEAINGLPADQKRVVKLAYFAGLSNPEIAQHLGLSAAGVQRRLRQAMATVSDYLERGRHVLYGLAALLAGRWFGEGTRHGAAPAAEQLARAGILVAACVTAGAVLVSGPVSPADLTKVDKGSAPAVTVSHAQVVARPDTIQVPDEPATTTAVDRVIGPSVDALQGTLTQLTRNVEIPPIPIKVRLPVNPAGVSIGEPTIPEPPKLGL